MDNYLIKIQLVWIVKLCIYFRTIILPCYLNKQKKINVRISGNLACLLIRVTNDD